MTRPARRAISELLAEDVAAAAVDFITGPLLEAPYRVGKPLRGILSGFHSARLGTQWRVLYRIDESKHAVIVQDIQPRSSAYRRRQARGGLLAEERKRLAGLAEIMGVSPGRVSQIERGEVATVEALATCVAAPSGKLA